MTFPDTWEEYEDMYSITDAEKIYTNGSRLIPTFRVRQWLDHMDALMNMDGVYDGTADTPQTDEEYINSLPWTERDTPQTEKPCDNCQEFDCYGCEVKQTDCGWK